MTTLLAQWTPTGDKRSRVVAIDTDTRRVAVIAEHPEWSYCRPVAAPDGTLSWLRIPVGRIVDDPGSLPDLMYRQGLDAPPLRVSPPSTWGPRGHPEWAPGSTRLAWAVWRTGAAAPGNEDYGIVTCGPRMRECRVVTPPGFVEPSWHRSGIVAVRKRDGALVRVKADGTLLDVWPTPPTGSEHPFDPYLHPAGSSVLYLHRDAPLFPPRLGLRILSTTIPADTSREDAEGWSRWLLGPFPALSDLVSQGRWENAEGTRVVCSYKRASEPGFAATGVDVLTGKVTAYTDPDGYEQVSVWPAGVSPWVWELAA